METNRTHSKRNSAESSTNDKFDERDATPQRATWVQTRNDMAVKWKRALGLHAATHLIKHGDVIQGGPGTTNVALMNELVERQIATKRGLDLIIMTTSLPIMAVGRDAKEKHVEILQGMQLILTGGALQGPIDSLVGYYSVEGICSKKIRPNYVFLGASGLSFDPEFNMRYQFEEELSSQEAYATRQADHRVLLCDHSKLGHDVGWRANLTLATVLEQAKSFLIISTYPDESDHSRAKVDQQVEAFRILIADLAKEMNSNPEHIFQGKEIALRLVNEYGEVVKEISLNENLVKADKAFLGAAVFPSQLKRAER